MSEGKDKTKTLSGSLDALKNAGTKTTTTKVEPREPISIDRDSITLSLPISMIKHFDFLKKNLALNSAVADYNRTNAFCEAIVALSEKLNIELPNIVKLANDNINPKQKK